MTRRLSATLALLSLLTSLAVVKLWVDSHRHVYVHERESRSASGRDWIYRRTLVAVEGGVFCWSEITRVQTLPIEAPPPPAPPARPRWSRTPRNPMAMRAYDLLPRTTVWNRLGFFKVHFVVAAGDTRTTTVWYGPMWSLALASGLPAAAWLAFRAGASMRRRSRRRRGLCPACGYDLRGSESDRCPECGVGEEKRG